MSEEKKTSQNARTGFGDRLKKYGKWRDETDMDRFLILTFITAEEKRAFCEKHLGFPEVDYMDGTDVETITLVSGAVERL